MQQRQKAEGLGFRGLCRNALAEANFGRAWFARKSK